MSLLPTTKHLEQEEELSGLEAQHSHPHGHLQPSKRSFKTPPDPLVRVSQAGSDPPCTGKVAHNKYPLWGQEPAPHTPRCSLRPQSKQTVPHTGSQTVGLGVSPYRGRTAWPSDGLAQAQHADKHSLHSPLTGDQALMQKPRRSSGQSHTSTSLSCVAEHSG